MRTSIGNISKTKSWFIIKINKINKPLSRIRKKERKYKLLKSEMKEETSLQTL
jgi:hypothetical protein